MGGGDGEVIGEGSNWGEGVVVLGEVGKVLKRGEGLGDTERESEGREEGEGDGEREGEGGEGGDIEGEAGMKVCSGTWRGGISKNSLNRLNSRRRLLRKFEWGSREKR